MPAPIGILLSNLGTPEAPTEHAVKLFLKEFLSDPYVVDIPKLIWYPILNGIVLRTRPQKTAEAYRKIWTESGSPLLKISQEQTNAIQVQLDNSFPKQFKAVLGMRYGSPALSSALQTLEQAGVNRIIVLPLYPQYSSTTTGSTFNAIEEYISDSEWQPELMTIDSYYDNNQYIDALASSILKYWDKNGRNERLLFSFHGLPEKCITKGDPYKIQCETTARLVAQELGLSAEKWQLCFQSRFGKAKWIQPYTAKTLIHLANSGVRSVDVVCPGFSADCLETLEEIAMLNRELFLANGGQKFQYIPALNEQAEHIHALAEIILNRTKDFSAIA